MISPWVYHPTTKAVHTSISGCQRAIGLRGYVSISLQWSRPRLSASFPTLHTPMTSLCPTLKVQKWQLMEAGAWAKMLQEKKTTRVLTDHSPWRRWAGWSGQCSLEERRKRWPRCTRGSECCALSTSFSSSASGLRTSGTPSRMDLPKETWCDHPGIIRKVFFFFPAGILSPLHFQNPPEAPVMSIALRFLALIMVMVSLPAVGR